ncbi:MAG: methyltransferase domain-containing protein [Clostridia bacterium]|nr:methyltransferase domain-containing protein [Clostridia bacterium]
MQYGKFAALYDEFMDGVNYGQWARYLLMLMDRFGAERGSCRPNTVFECGCGTGSITIPLKKAGLNITASDLSDEMLAVASEKARYAGQFIPFVRMDMRSLTLHRPVDAIIACCDCVNYLTFKEDVLAFFKSAYASLKAGGALYFDVSSEYKLSAVLGCNSFSDSREDKAYFWRNNYDPGSCLIEMDLDFFTAHGSGGLYERFREKHIQRAHSEEELTAWLREAGFNEVKTFACFTQKPVFDTTERIQFCAFKAQ